MVIAYYMKYFLTMMCKFLALNNLKDSENPNLKEAVAGALWELGGKSKRVESNNFSGEGGNIVIYL